MERVLARIPFPRDIRDAPVVSGNKGRLLESVLALAEGQFDQSRRSPAEPDRQPW